jgi:hypothetical protein
MQKLKRTLPLLAVSLLLIATACKKKKTEEKPDAREALYKSWTITEFKSPDADSATVATMTGYTVEFKSDGTCTFGDMQGTFTATEDASSMTMTLGGNTATYEIKGLTSSGMTLVEGEESMTLTVKQ